MSKAEDVLELALQQILKHQEMVGGSLPYGFFVSMNAT